MSRHGLFPILLFLAIACANVIAKDICNSIKDKSTMLRLKRHLLCDYDRDIRPIQNNNNVTRVSFRLIPHFFEYSDIDEAFDLHTWIIMSWNDSHFSWDPAQYEGIQRILVMFYEIWVPDILPHNAERIEGDSLQYGKLKCWIDKQGKVRWYTAKKFSTYCFADNTWWPYNTINCTIQFGSWSHAGDEIELIHIKIGSLLTDSNNEWDLLKHYATKWEDRYKYRYNSDSVVKMLSHHFILKRHWNIMHIVFISPIIVLMVMTLTALWLEPKSFERMLIANLNFVCHILCIQMVHWEMPKSGFNPPKLLIFYESSLAIASFTLILTSILRQLQELTTEPPMWISSGATSILRSRVGQILLISILDPAATARIEADADDNTDLVQSNTKKSPWRYVIVLIGWLAFLSVLLIYIALLSTCFPTYYTVLA